MDLKLQHVCFDKLGKFNVTHLKETHYINLLFCILLNKTFIQQSPLREAAQKKRYKVK